MGCMTSSPIGSVRQSGTSGLAEDHVYLEKKSETSEEDNSVFDAWDAIEQAEELDCIDTQRKK